MSGNIKRFGLSFVNAAEDIPRLIRAYGKCCEGECALVLRPHEGKAILVHHEKGGRATVWSEAQRGTQREAQREIQSDAPLKPTEVLDLKESVSRIKEYQKGLPKEGPISLRGSWSGQLLCEEGIPRVELTRKVASYSTLVISSVPGKGWKFRVIRSEKWFTRSGQSEGEAQTLMVAIQQGLASAMGLLGEACSIRDSRRRAALDAQYAEVHPLKPAREGKDPTEKFKVKETPPPKASAPKESKPRGRKSAPDQPIQSTQEPKTSSNATPKSAEAPAQTSAPRRTRTPRQAPMPAPAPTQLPSDLTDIDPAKDKLLLDAFGDAISKALAQLG